MQSGALWIPQLCKSSLPSIAGAARGQRINTMAAAKANGEWETIPRREPRSPRERLGPIRSQACAPDPLTEVVESRCAKEKAPAGGTVRPSKVEQSFRSFRIQKADFGA